MGVLELARAHLRRRRARARRAAAQVARIWARVDRRDIARSWAASIPAALTVVESAQAIAAASAGAYLDDILESYGLPGGSDGRVRVDAFAGTASDGRDLATLMYQPAISALSAIKQGATERRAMAAGSFVAELITETQTLDAGRVADGVALVARPQLDGWVRMLNPPSCSRCVILAGKWFRWNQGFDRHYGDDCVHVPANEDAADDLRTNPKAYFDSLTPAEQDKAFTKAGAEAIRLGSDIAQVVNARKGARGLSPAGGRLTAAEVKVLRGGRRRGRLDPVNAFGQDVLVTNEGVTVRGLAGRRLGARESGDRLPGSRYRSAKAPRLTPESILQIAGGDREEALRLLRRNGYLL